MRQSRQQRRAAFLVMMIALGGCDRRPPLIIPAPGPGASQLQPTSFFLTSGGDYRLNTVRPAPATTLQLDGRDEPIPQPVLCSEPSPDYATAISTLLEAAAKGGSGSASGSLSASASTTETLLAMAGRSSGVVALRDGLYAACQAYANGIIGRDDYALILSQYGDLLVSVVNSAASTSSAGGPAPGSAGADVGAGKAGASKSPQAPSPPSPPAVALQVGVLQQQALQALIVACLSEFDPTVHPRPPVNPLLARSCPALFDNVVTASARLLAPQDQARPAGRPQGRAAPPHRRTQAAHATPS